MFKALASAALMAPPKPYPQPLAISEPPPPRYEALDNDDAALAAPIVSLVPAAGPIDPLLLEAAMTNSDAMFVIGRRFQLGIGVPKNLPKAEHWFRLGAARQHLLCTFNLSTCLQEAAKNATDRTAAWDMMQKAAALGDEGAMNNIGHCYSEGLLVNRDQARAYTWFKKAANAGSFRAMSNLSNCFKFGHGVGQNTGNSVHWMRQAVTAAEKAFVDMRMAKMESDILAQIKLEKVLEQLPGGAPSVISASAAAAAAAAAMNEDDLGAAAAASPPGGAAIAIDSGKLVSEVVAKATSSLQAELERTKAALARAEGEISDLTFAKATLDDENRTLYAESEKLNAEVEQLQKALESAGGEYKCGAAGNDPLDTVSVYMKRKQWAALVLAMREGRVDTVGPSYKALTLMETASKARFDRGVDAISAFNAVRGIAPPKWTPTMMEDWFLHCVPSVDVTWYPSLDAAIHSLRPLTWAKVMDGPKLSAALAAQGVPDDVVQLVMAECRELVAKAVLAAEVMPGTKRKRQAAGTPGGPATPTRITRAATSTMMSTSTTTPGRLVDLAAMMRMTTSDTGVAT